jgi:hypothetical protein
MVCEQIERIGRRPFRTLAPLLPSDIVKLEEGKLPFNVRVTSQILRDATMVAPSSSSHQQQPSRPSSTISNVGMDDLPLKSSLHQPIGVPMTPQPQPTQSSLHWPSSTPLPRQSTSVPTTPNTSTTTMSGTPPNATTPTPGSAGRSGAFRGARMAAQAAAVAAGSSSLSRSNSRALIRSRSSNNVSDAPSGGNARPRSRDRSTASNSSARLDMASSSEASALSVSFALPGDASVAVPAPSNNSASRVPPPLQPTITLSLEPTLTKWANMQLTAAGEDRHPFIDVTGDLRTEKNRKRLLRALCVNAWMEDKKNNELKTPATTATNHSRDPTWHPLVIIAAISFTFTHTGFYDYRAYLAFQELRDNDPKEAIIAALTALMEVLHPTLLANGRSEH